MAGEFLSLSGLEYFKSKLDAWIDEKIEASPAVKIVTSGEGYVALSDGRILQWEIAYIANGNGTRVVFPVTFPNEIENVQCTASGSVPVACSATADGLGAAQVTHNGNGGVYVFVYAVGR